MNIKLYYCPIDNFGDKLNEIIFHSLSKADVVHCEILEAEVIGIGSLLDNLLKDSSNSMKKNKIKVFSTGFGFEEGGFFHNKNIILPETLKRNARCYALRGKLSDARMKKLLGKETKAVLGDGGLLVSKIFDGSKIKKIYDLGIVPHYADKENPIFEKIMKNIPNSCILDPTVPVFEFLNQLCQCKAVISTAMHPLIACDSLRIPNAWVRISESTTSRYKFQDYYSVFNMEKQPINLLENDFNQNMLKQIVNDYNITDNQINDIQDNLLSAYNKLISDVKRDKYQFYVMRLIKRILKFLVIFVPISKYRKILRNKIKYL